VDQYINTHTQVYILGHTDDVVKPENETYNNELSYRRALEVSQVVERHLASLGKHRGTDYQLFTIGMGKAQLLTRDAKEDLDHWRTNCRRIELQFRSLSPAKKLTE
jgi:outer membrane protein OmpA-like peptidoglycan-associated protein